MQTILKGSQTVCELCEEPKHTLSCENCGLELCRNECNHNDEGFFCEFGNGCTAKEFAANQPFPPARESSPLSDACDRLRLAARVLEATGWSRAEAIAKAAMVAGAASEELAEMAHTQLTEALRVHSEAEAAFVRALDDCRLAWENRGAK